jgi:hypothetical protein
MSGLETCLWTTIVTISGILGNALYAYDSPFFFVILPVPAKDSPSLPKPGQVDNPGMIRFIKPDPGALPGLLGICFWREGFEAAFGAERRGEKRG